MSVNYNTNLVRDGLVLQLDAANVKSYPGSGTVWKDLSGNEYNASLNNSVAYDTTNNGAFRFDGIDEYIATLYDMTNKINVTFQAWIKISSYPASGIRDVIFDQSTGSNGCLFAINTNGSLQAVAFNSAGQGLGAESSLILPLNEWKMVSVSFQNNRINYYMNLENTFINPTAGVIDIIKADTLNTLRVGATVDGFSIYNNFHGSISSVMIYEKVLSFEEVQQNFEALRGRFGI